MDVRLSPEQRALARRGGPGGRPARPAAVGQLDDASGARSSTRRSPPRAGGSCARRTTTARLGPRPSRSRSSPRSSDAASPTPRSSARRSPPTCGDGPARRRPPTPRPCVLDAEPRRRWRARRRRTCRRRDRHRRRWRRGRARVLPGPAATTLGAVPIGLGRDDGRPHPSRWHRSRRAPRSRRSRAPTRSLDDDDLAAVDAPSVSPRPAPTWSGS